MSGALLYEMAAFGVVASMVFFLSPPAPRREAGHGAAAASPVAVEA